MQTLGKKFNLGIVVLMMNENATYTMEGDIILGPDMAPLLCLSDYVEPKEKIISLLQGRGFAIIRKD